MKYYLHDSNSFNDEKITELYIKYGYEGLGIFYTILEKLAQQEKPIKTEVLKAQLGIGKRLNKCWSFMEEIGIISSSNGDTFNKQLLNYSEKYQIKKEKNRKKIEEWRVKHENVTSYEPVSNSPKVKLSKVKLSKDITPIESAPKKQAHNVFVIPSPKEVNEYGLSIGYPINGQEFVDYYTARGWKYKGGVAMKDWQAAVRTWKSKNTVDTAPVKKRRTQTQSEYEKEHEMPAPGIGTVIMGVEIVSG